MSVRLGKTPARPGAVRFKLSSYTNAAALPPVRRPSATAP
jgi:hypothetical protein